MVNNVEHFFMNLLDICTFYFRSVYRYREISSRDYDLIITKMNSAVLGLNPLILVYTYDCPMDALCYDKFSSVYQAGDV